MNRILKILNINADRNQRLILITLAIKGILITYSHPMLLKTIVSNLPAEWLAFESLFISISALLIGMLWKGKIRKTAIKHFTILAIGESICGFLLGMYLCFIHFNVWLYAIASLIYTSMISIFVGKCIMYFKTQLWNERSRELYDNNTSIVTGIVCIIGYLFALVAMPSLEISLFLWGLCCIIDDIGWILLYQREIKGKYDEEN